MGSELIEQCKCEPHAEERTTSVDADPAQFGREASRYLHQVPKQLPSRYLYDALGSALFEAICELPWYSITRTERRLLGIHRHQILSMSGNPGVVVELGSGSGEKLASLLRDGQMSRQVHLVDVSDSALSAAERRLAEVAGLTVIRHHAEYEDGLENVAHARRDDESMLALFLGSTIGNFDQPAVHAFLKNVHRSLWPGDTFLVGVDLVKPESELLMAYDDPLGATAAFNKNLLVRLNTELGARFDLTLFEHRVIWNVAQSRIEMHLESRVRQDVEIPRARMTLVLEAGERIWTESSYKWEASAFETELKHGGFEPIANWNDHDGRFLLVMGRVN